MRHAMRWTIILGLVFAAAAAWAENWPSRLIKATIPFGAGSAADVVPRVVFDRLSAELGQAIVVENRPGAGGTLGTAAVVKAEPDGYSVLAQSSALAISPAIYPKLNFDVTKDLASALMIGVSANVMIVPVTRPWKTVQDFITDARAKPGSIVFGSVGIGSATHISAEKFRLAAGIETTHVPYRGGAEVVADILGGRVDFYFCPLATALPLIREGRVHALVVSTPKRVAELPDVPTPAEAGLKKRRKRVLARRVHAGENAARCRREISCCGGKTSRRAFDARKSDEARHRAKADDATGNGRVRGARNGGKSRSGQGRRDQALKSCRVPHPCEHSTSASRQGIELSSGPNPFSGHLHERPVFSDPPA